MSIDHEGVRYSDRNNRYDDTNTTKKIYNFQIHILDDSSFNLITNIGTR